MDATLDMHSSQPAVDVLLEQIRGDHSTDEYLDRVWRDEVIVTHGPLNRFEFLEHFPLLTSPQELANQPGLRAKVYLDGDPDSDGVVVEASAGWRLFRSGLTIALMLIDDALPDLKELGDALARTLGARRSATSLFVGPARTNVRPHIDRNPVVILQVQGTKRWYVGRDADKSQYSGVPVVQAPLENLLTEGATFDLEPGSALFMPAGIWHATEDITQARSESIGAISLSFAMESASWGAALMNVLAKTVVVGPEWTWPVRWPVGSRGRQETLAECQRRVDQLREWSASGLLEVLLPAHARPRGQDRFVAVGEWQVLDGGDGLELVVESASERFSVSVLRSWSAVLQQLMTPTGATVAEIEASLGANEWERFERLLLMLFENGLVDWKHESA